LSSEKSLGIETVGKEKGAPHDVRSGTVGKSNYVEKKGNNEFSREGRSSKRGGQSLGYQKRGLTEIRPWKQEGVF